MIMIDTEIPTCCEDCFAQQEYYNPRFDETEYSCGINGENLGTHSRQDWGKWHCDKPEWCPLKEQEVVSVVQREFMHLLVWCCGSCGVAITHGDKFCRNCGKAVKWND